MTILTLDDTRSPTWRKVMEYAAEQLAIHRKNLETDCGPERTAKLRGQIRSLVLLTALGSPPALPTEETDEPD